MAGSGLRHGGQRAVRGCRFRREAAPPTGSISLSSRSDILRCATARHSLAAEPRPAHHRDMRGPALLVVVSVAVGFAGCTSSSSSDETSSVRVQGVRATITVVHQHLANKQVALYATPDGYVPRVQPERALSLGLAQLGDPTRVKNAHLYLGEFWVHGTSESAIPAWVMVVGPSGTWCIPRFGPSSGSDAEDGTTLSASACYFGVSVPRSGGNSGWTSGVEIPVT